MRSRQRPYRSYVPMVAGLLLCSCVAPDESNRIPELTVRRLELSWRFVSHDSSVLTSLTRVTGLAVSPNGDVYTAHSNEGIIRHFSAEGKLLGAFGRKGNGPGEFREIAAIGFIDQMVWALDGRRARIEFFSADGKWLKQGIIPRTGFALLDEYRVLAGPRILADEQYFNVGASRLTLDSSILTVADLEGNRIARVPIVGVRRRVPINIPVNRKFGETTIMTPLVPTSTLLAAPDGGTAVLLEHSGLWDGPPGALRIWRIVPSGDTSHTDVDLGATPYPDSLVDAEATRRTRGSTTPGAAAIYRTALNAPTHFHAFETALFGWNETLWLKRGQSPDTLLVISARTGEKLMRVAIPRDFSLHHASPGSVWGIEEDSLGLPAVVAYRVVTSG